MALSGHRRAHAAHSLSPRLAIRFSPADRRSETVRFSVSFELPSVSVTVSVAFVSARPRSATRARLPSRTDTFAVPLELRRLARSRARTPCG